MTTTRQLMLARYQAEAEELKAELSPWRGLTIAEATLQGFGEEQAGQQARLWALGFQIVDLQRTLRQD